MIRRSWSLRFALALVLIALVAGPAGATTLIRMGLDDLVADNELVIVGRVVDAHSHWNADGTFIVTDVRVAVEQLLKGSLAEGQEDVTFTVMGGTVGDKTVVIVAGPQLELDASYALFLSRGELPGAPAAVTVRDLCQGAFDVVETAAGARAVSQAAGHPLLADWRGTSQAPGGVLGIALGDFVRQVRTLANAR